MFNIRSFTFIIDDSIIYRSRNKKTVKGAILYDHSNKANRSRYVWGQNILMLAAVVNIFDREIALPVIIHLLNYADKEKSNNTNKITSSAKMINIVKHFFKEHQLPCDNITITFDSFFAKRKLIDSTCKLFPLNAAIFQARRDTAVFYLPKATTEVKKGRKRIYGERIRINIFSHLKNKYTLFLYGKEQTVCYKEIICKARFLKGRTVKAVYCRLGSSKKIILYISTDISLSSIEILRLYEKRWKIEPLFNELKNTFFFKDIWMQTVSSYQKFLHLKLFAFVITQIASLNNFASLEFFVKTSLTWRIKVNKTIPITNGITQLALSEFLRFLTFNLFISKVRIISLNNIIPVRSLYFNKLNF